MNFLVSTAFHFWVNQRGVTDRQTDRQTDKYIAKTSHFRWGNVIDNMFRIDRGSFFLSLTWMDPSFTKMCAKKCFYIFLPVTSTVWPRIIVPLFRVTRVYHATKFELSTVHTDRRTKLCTKNGSTFSFSITITLAFDVLIPKFSGSMNVIRRFICDYTKGVWQSDSSGGSTLGPGGAQAPKFCPAPQILSG